MTVVLPGTGFAVNITPSYSVTTTVAATNDSVTATARLPPTPVIDVRWTLEESAQAAVVVAAAAAAASAAAAAATPATVTQTAAPPVTTVSVAQEVHVRVTEGVVFIDTKMAYDIRGGAVSQLELAVDPRLRVLAVSGSYVRSFRSAGPVLRVVFDQQVQDQYSLTLSTELPLPPMGVSSSGARRIVVPSVAHVPGLLPGLVREKGVIAIEAQSNVEVEVVGLIELPVAADAGGQGAGLAPLAAPELPAALRARANSGQGTVVAGFKFARAAYGLDLAVTKHEDQSVLVAAAEAAHFVTTVTPEGRIMTKLIMRVRNTQKQYVRIQVPAASDIWSAMVDGAPVKPARCEASGAVMVPLVKGAGTAAASFQVELLWVRPAPFGRMTGRSRGFITLAFPVVDLPLNSVFVTVFLPSRFKYEDWTGDCREVSSFQGSTQAPEEAVRALSTVTASSFMPSQMRMAPVSKTGAPRKGMPFNAGPAFSGGKSSGAIPVHVNTIRVGTRFFFQRLLVVGESFEITTTVRMCTVLLWMDG